MAYRYTDVTLPQADIGLLPKLTIFCDLSLATWPIIIDLLLLWNCWGCGVWHYSLDGIAAGVYCWVRRWREEGGRENTCSLLYSVRTWENSCIPCIFHITRKLLTDYVHLTKQNNFQSLDVTTSAVIMAQQTPPYPTQQQPPYPQQGGGKTIWHKNTSTKKYFLFFNTWPKRTKIQSVRKGGTKVHLVTHASPPL